ncbi:MAG: ParB/RepB/Spo0J family partition protein [Gammaproteobacteria bacterium]|nr:ParB/RepB/Spo0J family partition protein [Gammaproteobacteria bacterium]
MAAKKRGLGKGLTALLGSSAKVVSIEASDSAEIADENLDGGQLKWLPVDTLQRGVYQPRIDIDPESLEELADSIRAQGVVQPIVVRPLAEPGRYEIIAGERRWRATQLAGLHEIPAVIRDVSDQDAMAIELIENIQREQLNPMEEANALQRLIDEFGMTHQLAADAVGRSRTAVSNLLRLLSLNDDVKRMVENGDMEMGHARALLALEGDHQSSAARTVAGKGLTVRETERLVKRLLAEKSGEPKKRAHVDPDVIKLEQHLGEKLGAKVSIQQGARGRGKMVIQYNSLDELDGIIDHIK